MKIPTVKKLALLYREPLLKIGPLTLYLHRYGYGYTWKGIGVVTNWPWQDPVSDEQGRSP